MIKNGMLLLVLLLLTGCSSKTIDWESAEFNEVVLPEKWILLEEGMSYEQFLQVTFANGYRMPDVMYTRGYGLDGKQTLRAGSDDTHYSFELDEAGIPRLGPVSKISSCLFVPDEGGAYVTIYSETKLRTKELFANSAAYLDFFLFSDIPDILLEASSFHQVDGAQIEGLLSARFEETESGTKVFANTESRLLVLESRHKSMVSSILKHMHCVNQIFDNRPTETPLAEGDTSDLLVDGQLVELSNYRTVSLFLFKNLSTFLENTGEVELLVNTDIIIDGTLVIAKGARAWGKVIQSSECGSDALKLGLSKVQATDGKWIGIKMQQGPISLENDCATRTRKNRPQLVWGSAVPFMPIGVIINGVVDLSESL